MGREGLGFKMEGGVGVQERGGEPMRGAGGSSYISISIWYGWDLMQGAGNSLFLFCFF